jgi:superfamily II DNA/RNA helicase
MEQQEREAAMCKFKNGSSNILITTDLASRGLDIPDIKYIIHYHLPVTEDVNTHRNGRTGRMFSGGKIVYILSEEEILPNYITQQTFPLSLPTTITLPEKPSWSTLFIAAGKKDKVNKIDIVGFLHNNAALKKDDIGLIEVKDFYAFAAIRKNKIGNVIELVKDKKLKNKKVKIDIAK